MNKGGEHFRLFCPLVLTFFGTVFHYGVVASNETTVSDLAGIYSTDEIQIISKQCADLKKSYGIDISFHTYTNGKDRPALSKLSKSFPKQLILEINFTAKKALVHVSSDIRRIQKEYFTQVAFQWIEQNFENGRQFQGTIGALKEIDGHYKKKSHINGYLQADDQIFTPRTGYALTFLLTVLIGFIILSVWSTMAGNYYENVQSYGTSRMPLWSVILTGFVLAISSVIFLYNYIFYYDELAVVLIAFVFAFWPLLTITCLIVSLVIDTWRVFNLSLGNKKYSLGQKLLLLNSGCTGELLLELNFYELIIQKCILIEYIEKEFTNHTKTFVMVTKSNHVDISALPEDQIPYITAFTEDKMMLEDYLHQLYTKVLSFKGFKKDFVGLELLKKGHIPKVFWVFNLLRSIGGTAKNAIRLKIDKMEDILNRLSDKASIKGELLKLLNEEALLLNNFEKKLDSIFNNFVDEGKFALLSTSKLAPIFHEKFSFDSFNKKLARSYKTSGQSWDWADPGVID